MTTPLLLQGSIERSHGKLLRPTAMIRTVWLSHRLTLCLRVCACTHAVLWTKRCGICFQPSVWGAKRGKGTRRQPGCSSPTQQPHQCHTCPLCEAALGPDILCSIQSGHNGNCVWNQPQNTGCFTCFEGDTPSSWHFLKQKKVKERRWHIFNKIKANCAPNVYTWSRQIWGVVQQSSVNLTLSFAPCWLIVRYKWNSVFALQTTHRSFKLEVEEYERPKREKRIKGKQKKKPNQNKKIQQEKKSQTQRRQGHDDSSKKI